MTQRRYEDLFAWQKAHQLVLSVYKETAQFPSQEQYGLVNQMRRAAASVAANIVEGHSRVTSKDFRHFLSMSRGSANEVDYFCLLSRDLGYIADEPCTELRSLCGDVVRLVTRLMVSLKENN